MRISRQKVLNSWAKVGDLVKQSLIMETETGEVVNHINEGDSFRLIRKETKDYLRGTVEVNKGEAFVKVYAKTLFELSKSLTGTESQFVNYLIQYIRYTSGILAHSNANDSHPLTRQHMAQETGLSIKTVDRIMRSLQDKQVIGKHRTGNDITFTVNPFIFMKGDRINETLYNFFKNTRWNKTNK